MLKYFENTKDTTLRETAPKTAPYIWLLNCTLCLGINLYSNKNTTKVTTINAIPVIKDDIKL